MNRRQVAPLIVLAPLGPWLSPHAGVPPVSEPRYDCLLSHYDMEVHGRRNRLREPCSGGFEVRRLPSPHANV